ncbi:sulfotransferase domain-containing protein [Candidatus Thioglobus sp.]|nr:sulfotransferase domain-containing protein [Candidatus Thioglobus sp.]
MISNKRIFSTGTMRTGGTLLLNLLSVHSKIAMFNERVNYFRFFYNKNNSFSLENAERMINHYKIRLQHRSNITYNLDTVFKSIKQHKSIDNSVLYNELMQDLIRPTGKELWGEYANLSWRYIPSFLDMFPNGKVIHICRDLRGVLASFGKISYMPDNLYLNAIFNWIDSVNYIEKYKNNISSKNYMFVKFEDIHTNPEETIREICDFLEEPFEEIMIQGDKWKDLIDEKVTKVNISVYTNKKVYGFDKKRNETWVGELKPWELALCDFLAGNLMDKMGYKRTNESFTGSDIEYGLNLLYRQPYLCKTLEHFLKTGEGVDCHPVDSVDPMNWSAPDSGYNKFIDSPAYGKYMSDMKELEIYLNKKYG